MKKYLKPFIEDEDIEIEDICAMSGVTKADEGSSDTSGSEDTIQDIWPGL